VSLLVAAALLAMAMHCLEKLAEQIVLEAVEAMGAVV